MLLKALMQGVVARRLLAAGALVAVAALLPGCSDTSKTAAPAKTASAPAAPADAAAKTAEAVKSAADKTAAATKEAAEKTAAAVKGATEQTVAAAKDATQKAGLAATQAAQKASNDVAATQAGKAPTPELKSPEQIKAETQKALDAKAAAAKGAVDPLTDTDPNSKARITYEFGSDTINFGKVMQGDVLNHKFLMQSSGEEDLIIKQAKPTCGCTVAQITAQDNEGQMVPYQYGKPLPPGRKIEIAATLHTQNKRGHAGSKINMFTNDPRGQTILSLEADVDPFFTVNPPSINFQNLSQKDTATDKLTVTTAKGQRVKLSAVKDNMPQGLKIDLKALDEDAEGKATRWELVATAGPGLVEGSLAYSVQLKSDMSIPGGEKMPNGAMPTYEVQATVMARVTGAISFNPQFVSLGLIRPGQTMARTVRITSHDGEFKLTAPEVSIQGRDTAEWEFSKNFNAVVRPVPNENAVDVEVTLNGLPDSLSGSFSGMLVVKIGHPDKPEIKIPITGVCRGGAGAPGAEQAPK
ncbi:MAG: DUF1573 domain-containing protein [Planctomycetota bacterium]|nr:DUF1573 domain-containing protein [Planctomycetota bacterium]